MVKYIIRFKKGNRLFISRPMTNLMARKEVRQLKAVNRIEGTRTTLGIKNIRIIKKKRR